MKNWIVLVGFFLLLKSAFALVEYDDEYTGDSVSSKQSSLRKTNTSFKKTKNLGKSSSFAKNSELQVGYESVGLDLNSKESTTATLADIHKYNFGLHLDTAYDIYLDASFWTAKSGSDELLDTQKSQKGNAHYKIGFNWFKSTGENPVQADIYLAYVQGAKNSQFASSRNDQIIGLETSKRIHKVALGLGAEYRRVGNPKEEEEYAVGNISKFAAGFAWLVSNDIRFTFEAAAYKISESDDRFRANKWEDEISFSVFSPALHLQLFRSLEMKLGAHVRTNKPQFENESEINSFLNAKLLDLPGVYGNSVYSSLNLSF